MPPVGDRHGNIDAIWILGRVLAATFLVGVLYLSLVLVAVVADGSPIFGAVFVGAWAAGALAVLWKFADFFRP